MNDQKTYLEMLNKFRMKLITQKEWYDFCRDRLDTIMEENKDVFIRLRDR